MKLIVMLDRKPTGLHVPTTHQTMIDAQAGLEPAIVLLKKSVRESLRCTEQAHILSALDKDPNGDTLPVNSIHIGIFGCFLKLFT